RAAPRAGVCAPRRRACGGGAMSGARPNEGGAMSDAAPDEGRTMSDVGTMALEDAIRLRRSVRGFRPDEVPKPILHEVFTLAQQAPSSCNVQRWIPHVVTGPALATLRDALVTAGATEQPIEPDWPADGRYEGVYRTRQHDAAAQLYGAMGVARKD